jgi:Tfp pilus assembly protein PilF
VDPRRASALALLAFGLAGPLGAWDGLPAGLLLVGFALLPGVVALQPCVAACRRDERDCPMSGPGGVAVAVAFSLLALVPAVLPLFVLGVELDASRFTLGFVYCALGAAGMALAPEPASRRSGANRLEWILTGLAIALLLPGVVEYAGGAVDDWWDLAFIRAYTDAPALGFGEPFFGTGDVHPRFAWSGWRMIQALAVEFSGAEAIDFQARELAVFVCVSSVCAAAGLARAVFGVCPAASLTILAVPVWLYGTEPFPYFVRLHQDKFVAALVLLPALLAAVIGYLKSPVSRGVAVVAVCALALSTVHGVVTAVALLGAGICVLCRYGSRLGEAALLRALLPLVCALAAAIPYPAWQALAVGTRFLGQGIGLVHPDNPVIRAHLALGRLLWPDSPFSVVNPAAVFGSVSLVALGGLIVAVRNRRESDARYLLGLTVIPMLIVFTPLVSGLAGRILVPWMLYRVAWLVPVPMLIGYLLAKILQLSVRRPVAATACGLAAALLLTATVVPTASARFARGMREHPHGLARAPRGSTLEVYRVLGSLPRGGAVLAPPGFSNLVPALSGRPVVAFSERGTVVFSRRESDAYRRLRDRATFLSRRTSSDDRERIARRYNVAYAVFPKRSVTARSRDEALARETGASFLLGRERDWAEWASDAGLVAAALADIGTVVHENHDYVVAEIVPARSSDADESILEEREPGAGRVRGLIDRSAIAGKPGESWMDALGIPARKPRSSPSGALSGADGLAADVLASSVGYPGADLVIDPLPSTLGLTRNLVWASGRALWEDGPAEVRVRLGMTGRCRVRAVEVVPFLQTGRRAALEVLVDDQRTVARASDGRPLRVAVESTPRSHVVVHIRSVLGMTFGLTEIRLLGDRSECEAEWKERAETNVPEPGALAALSLALSHPRDADAVLPWARFRQEEGADADARTLLRRAVAIDPSSVRAWLEYGLAEDSAGNTDAAVAAFEEALARDSNSAWAHGCMAWIRSRQGAPVSALRHAAKAVALDPRYADAYAIVASSLDAFGLRGVAITMLDRAVQLDPRRAWPRLRLAALLAEERRTEAAVETLDAFLRLVPDDKAAREMLAQLRGERAE